MTVQGGYAGSILYVDLDSAQINKEPLRSELVKDFLGGAGINAQLAYDSIKPVVNPLDPGNALIFGVGPLVGTLIPGAGKSCCLAKSPISKKIGASVTGSLGALKFAGYDHLVITGKADRPVYLTIQNDDVRLVDARHVWGKDTFNATDDLWKDLGNEFTVLTIGPAGENLTANASIVADKYSCFSRGGLGSVMGSKNLKAVAIHGSKDIRVVQPDRFTEALDSLNSEFFSQRLLKEWRVYGTLVSLQPMAKAGLYPFKNYQEAVEAGEMIRSFDVERFLQVKAGDVACMSCPIGCKHRIHVKEGKYAGLQFTVGCANAAMQTWGSYCGCMGSWDVVFKGAELCNRFGMDFYDTSALVSWAIEIYKKGLIDNKETNGLELDWGKADAIQELMEQIAYRRDFGDTLARGLIEAPRIVGRGSEEYAVHVKGMAPPFDARARISSESFSQFVCSRGGHSIGVTTTMMPRKPGQMRRFAARTGLPPEDAVERVLTGPEEFHAGRISRWFEDNLVVLDALGICQFPPFQQVNLAAYAELYSALTGIEINAAGLLQAAEKVSYIRRAFNIREKACSPEEDVAPRRFVNETLKFGEEQRAPLDKKNISELVTGYYDERGWNPDGSIKENRIKTLGLNKYLGDA